MPRATAGTPSVARGGAANGGALATAGAATGGSTCGTDRSAFTEQLTFTTSAAALSLLDDEYPSPSLLYAKAVTSPTAAPSLCNGDCAALSATFTPSATAMGTNVRIVHFYTPNQNLLGSTVTFSIAVNNPSELPIRLRISTGGDRSVNNTWGTVISVDGIGLDSYSVTKGFNNLSVNVLDQGTYCASATYFWLLWLDVIGPVAKAGTVTVYLKQVTVAPMGASIGAGGTTSGAGGSSVVSALAGAAGRTVGAGGASGHTGVTSSGASAGRLGTGGTATTGGNTSYVGSGGRANTSASGTAGGAAGSAGFAGSAGCAGLAGCTN